MIIFFKLILTIKQSLLIRKQEFLKKLILKKNKYLKIQEMK